MSVLSEGTTEAAPFVLVSDQTSGKILRFDATTGGSLGVFASHPGMTNVQNLTMGPDGDLYVADAVRGIYRFDGETGNFVDLFVDAQSTGNATPVISAAFGPDASLYLTSATEIRRYNGATGAFIDTFASSPDGLGVYYSLAFGPDGRLYAGARFPHKVERFEAATGIFVDLLIAPGPEGIFDPRQMLFHTDGLLYIASENSSEIRRFDPETGELVDIFASGRELEEVHSFWFGPNGNLHATSRSNRHIVELDGTTGAFVGIFAAGGDLTSPTWAILVPEPSVLGLLAVGLVAAALLASSRHRRRTS